MNTLCWVSLHLEAVFVQALLLCWHSWCRICRWVCPFVAQADVIPVHGYKHQLVVEPVVPRSLALPAHRALIIGNNKSSDPTLPSLTQCVQDAEDVAAFFSTHGYAVTTVLDGCKDCIMGTLGRFVASLVPGCTVILYFSGHGFSSGGHNFLVPVDGKEAGREGTGPFECGTHWTVVCFEGLPQFPTKAFLFLVVCTLSSGWDVPCLGGLV
jgi:hypothetical protein